MMGGQRVCSSVRVRPAAAAPIGTERGRLPVAKNFDGLFPMLNRANKMNYPRIDARYSYREATGSKAEIYPKRPSPFGSGFVIFNTILSVERALL